MFKCQTDDAINDFYVAISYATKFNNKMTCNNARQCSCTALKTIIYSKRL